MPVGGLIRPTGRSYAIITESDRFVKIEFSTFSRLSSCGAVWYNANCELVRNLGSLLSVYRSLWSRTYLVVILHMQGGELQ